MLSVHRINLERADGAGPLPDEVETVVAGRVAVRDEFGILVDELRDVLARRHRHALCVAAVCGSGAVVTTYRSIVARRGSSESDGCIFRRVRCTV